MTLEDRVRQAFEPLADQLRSDLSSRISATVDQLKAGLEADQAATVAAARETAVREVTARLTEEFDAERVAAVAQAATDAASAAERDAVERLTRQFDAERANAVAQVARETSESVERSVTDRLTVHHESERARAVSEAIEEASARVERETTERLTRHHENERADAVARTADETWSRAEQEITDRLTTSFHDTHTRSRADGEAAEVAASLRLVDSIRALDACRTLSEVLHALSNGAAAEASRTTVLLVEADGFRSSRTHGFDEAVHDGVLQVTHEHAGIIGEAARTARAATVSGGFTAPAFASLPDGQRAIAVPIVLTGRVVGVLYADQGGEGFVPRPTWQSALEILGRHGSRVLEALTAAKLAEAATGRSMKAPLPEGDAVRTATAQAGSWN